MPDGTIELTIQPPKTRTSDQFGHLVEGEAFVQHEHEPADQLTRETVDDLLKEFNLPYGKGKNPQRYVRCLSDVLVAIRAAPRGLFCWPMGNESFTGEAYGADIARKVKDALTADGWMWKYQLQSKSDKLAMVYEADKTFVSPKLRFKCHGAGQPVIVRSKTTRRGNKKSEGKRLPRRGFLPKIAGLEKQVQAINDFHKNHPLVFPNDVERSRCRRIFNNGSLTVGGRLYGPWQQMDEDERLTCRIDGERLCEIDLKASYLSIAHAILVDEGDLGFDPYERVKCVKEANNKDRKHQLRGLVKLLVVTYVSQSMHHPEKEALTKYPQGKNVRDELTGVSEFFSVRERFDVCEPVEFYKNQILEAFPFLINIQQCPYDVMYMESEVMLTSIDNLNKKGIPAYPVHDCLLVKLSDKDSAVEELIQSQIRHLGKIIHMDCSYFNEEGNKIEEPITQELTTDKAFQATFKRNTKFDWAIDENLELIEDY